MRRLSSELGALLIATALCRRVRLARRWRLDTARRLQCAVNLIRSVLQNVTRLVGYDYMGSSDAGRLYSCRAQTNLVTQDATRKRDRDHTHYIKVRGADRRRNIRCARTIDGVSR